jgi:hypothetical protein
MSATYAPFGLKPVYHPSGIIRTLNYTGAYDDAVTFYSGTPVALSSSGTASEITVAGNSPTSTTRLMGVFQGVEYTDASGRRTVSKWFGPALGTASDIIFWITDDQEIVYEIQANGSLPDTSVGQEFNFTAVTSGQIIGNGGLGTSTAALDTTDVDTGDQGQVIVVGLGREITNAWGDDNTIVQVKLANTQFAAANVE